MPTDDHRDPCADLQVTRNDLENLQGEVREYKADQARVLQSIFVKLDAIRDDFARRPPAWMTPVIGVLTLIIGVLSGVVGMLARG